MNENILNQNFGGKELSCGRCRAYDAEMMCSNCDSQFKYTCLNCDNIIHSLPSKKNHKRSSIEAANFKSTNTSRFGNNPQSPVDAGDANSDYNQTNKFNIKNYNTISPIRPNMMKGNPQLFSINSNDGQMIDEEKERLNQESEFKQKSAGLFFVSDSYSKEYLNEIRSVHEKEKSEMSYKYITLQSNFERMKGSLTDQINNLQSQLEDINRKNNTNIKFIREENALLMEKLKNEKDLEIKKLIENIEELEKANDELFSRVEENYSSMQDYKRSFHNKLQDLNEILERKDQDVVNTKMHYEKILNDLTRNFEEEKIKLTASYESTIQRIRDQSAKSQDENANEANEKERMFKEEIEKALKELEKADVTIFELKKEVDYHKQNLLAYRGKRQEMEKDIEIMMKNMEKYKKENNYQLTELKMIDNENKNLLKENEELKLQITKLERFIQGKKVNKLS